MRRIVLICTALGLALAACHSSTGPSGSTLLITSGNNQTVMADSVVRLAVTARLEGTRQKSGRGILFAPTADTTYVHHPLAKGNCSILVERTDTLGGQQCSAVDSTDGGGQAFIIMTAGPTPGVAHLIVTLLHPLQSDTVTLTIMP